MENYGYTNPENPENQNRPPLPEHYRSDKKVPAGVLALLLGWLGVHKFYLGYTAEGIILLATTFIVIPILTLITCGMGAGLYLIVGVVPLIEGIIYLSMPDRNFDETYIRNKKPWF